MTAIYIKKLDETFEVDFAAMDKAGQDYIIDYGLKQSLSDCISAYKAEDMDKTETRDEASEVVASRIKAIMAGRVGTIRTGDPVEVRAKEIARSRILAAAKKAGITRKQLEEAMSMPRRVDALLAQSDTCRTLAAEQIRMESEADADTIDLGL